MVWFSCITALGLVAAWVVIHAGTPGTAIGGAMFGLGLFLVGFGAGVRAQRSR